MSAVPTYRTNLLGLAAASLVTLALCTAPAASQPSYQDPSRVNVAWNRLYDYDEVTQICRDLTAAYPELLTMASIGKSYEGRDMWALTLNVAATGPHDAKPAMYIDANIHGNEVQGSEVVLYSIWYLTKSYGKVPALTELMDRASFYFIPMVNPDGRAYWFAAPNSMHSSRTGKVPVDNDGDGLFDEDPPNDVDGDGELLQMRIPDPLGGWRVSPEDPRVMLRVGPEDRGEFQRYSLIFSEGIDDDGDGEVNEDGPGGYDPNRNWPADWQPNHIQFGAHDYPLSLPESKCIADFILARPNIAATQAYHNSGGMILRSPGAEYVKLSDADVETYDRIGRRGEQILPFYRYMIIWKDLYTVHGGFVNWVYDDLGIISFTNELWTDAKYFLRAEEGDRGDQRDRQMLFNDHLMFGQSFIPWKPAKHPVYGDVELGGWIKMTGRVPPAFHLEEECHRNFAFTVFHAEQMPLVSLSGLTVEPQGDGLFRVRVNARNERLIATTSGQAADRRIGPRDKIEILGDGLRVAAGGVIDNRRDGRFEFVEHQPHRLWLDRGLAGETTRTYQWLVSGSGRFEIRFSGSRVTDVSAAGELP